MAILVFIGAIQTYGQDVAETATQEKARKAADQNSSKHVYTEDDFKRRVILTPEDKARAEAHQRQQDTTPSAQNAQQTLPETHPTTESLGEVARRYRQEKAAREAELASKKKFTPFLYKLPEHSLAMPEPGITPLVAPDSGGMMNGRAKTSVPRLAPNSLPHSHGRLSPFQPRPLTGDPSAFPGALVAVPLPSRPAIERRPAEKNALMAVNTGMQRVTVQQGQSWWKLAELYLGNGVRWPELKTLNPDTGVSAELLKAGSLVLVPKQAKGSPALSAESVEVHRGDSLWSLAKEHLGRGSAWMCLANRNPNIIDYTHLTIGTTLQLPNRTAPDSCLARQSSIAPR